MRRNLLLAVALLTILALTGCTGMLIGNALGQGQNLTPEQVDTYNRIGSKVYGCFVVSGPPPSGATMWIVVPKDATVTAKFGDNCHLVSQ